MAMAGKSLKMFPQDSHLLTTQTLNQLLLKNGFANGIKETNHLSLKYEDYPGLPKQSQCSHIQISKITEEDKRKAGKIGQKQGVVREITKVRRI